MNLERLEKAVKLRNDIRYIETIIEKVTVDVRIEEAHQMPYMVNWDYDILPPYLKEGFKIAWIGYLEKLLRDKKEEFENL